MEPLSEYMLETIRQLDEDFEKSDRDQKENREHERWVDTVTKTLLSSREVLTWELVVQLDENAFKSFDFAFWLDDHCTREMLRKVPKMVQRTMRLTTLRVTISPKDLVKRLPDRRVTAGPVNTYLREATRTYVSGFWHASVVLARAALEQGLRDVLGDAAPHPAELNDLIEGARRLRLLDAEQTQFASEVKRTGNRVVHQKPSNEREAWDTLCKTRMVLVHLYTAKASAASRG